ncbi:hypothetical protein HDU96_000973 [Phlyctochytrium bullatum]|nr:hypothetical protein HDU96_000973 [Phlyctochytrium bullatum]
MDGSTECLPEDVELLGVSGLRAFYRSLSPASITRELSHAFDTNMVTSAGATTTLLADFARVNLIAEQECVSVRMARVAHLAKVFSENDVSRLERRERVAKALAVELLKNQIGSIESSLQRIRDITVPILIPDSLCYVQNLKFIKTILMSRSAVLVIPQAVLHDLDRMKKGSDLMNVRAREAIRYLEQRFKYFKYPNIFLKVQQDGETEELPPLSGLNEQKLLPPSVESATSTQDRNGVGLAAVGSNTEANSSSATAAPLSTTNTQQSLPTTPFTTSPVIPVSTPVAQAVPKHHRGILRCSLYYKNNVALRPVDSDEITLALVTDDEHLRHYAKELGMASLSTRECLSSGGRNEFLAKLRIDMSRGPESQLDADSAKLGRCGPFASSQPDDG